jgi:hypothetical protein
MLDVIVPVSALVFAATLAGVHLFSRDRGRRARAWRLLRLFLDR